MTVSLKYLALALMPVALLACSSPSAPSAPSPDGGSSSPGEVAAASTASSAEEGASVPAVGGTEDSVGAPEFRAIRAAIQPIIERKSAAGNLMADACMKAEVAVASGAPAVAEKHLKSILEALDKSDLSSVPDRSRAALYAAFAKDLDSIRSNKGAPKLKIKKSKDKLCGKGGTCSEASAGALCYTATFSNGDTSCGCVGAGGMPGADEAPKEAKAPAKSAEAAAEEAEAEPKSESTDIKEEKGSKDAEPTESSSKKATTKKPATKKATTKKPATRKATTKDAKSTPKEEAPE